MTLLVDDAATQSLSLTEELILMLLNEENGYFHQVPGWNLNCAVVGAVLAELSLLSRIDTDLETLFLIDDTETGEPALDPILKEIAAEPARRSTQYWIERLAVRAESIIDLSLERLVELGILEYHDGDFWTLSHSMGRTEMFGASVEGTRAQFVKARIALQIFDDEIPTPRDIIIISLINACDVFRFIFPLDEVAEERIEFICNMTLIGRSIAEEVSNNLSNPLLRHSPLAKKIPDVSLRKLIFNPHARDGNIPALFADLAEQYGPVFQIRPPFKEPMIFLAGPDTNQWAQRSGRMYLRARDYFQDFEKVYGASGYMPALDGADHFRLRRAMQSAHSRGRLEARLDELYHHARTYISDWTVGDSFSVTSMCRQLAIGELAQLSINVDPQDIIEDMIKYKERALSAYVLKALPRFMMRTPGMRRRAKIIEELPNRILSSHTAAQRYGAPRDLADDLLSLHASDPQLLSESNLRFALSMSLLAGVYCADTLAFAVYSMASQPELYDRIRSEADALFANGDPDADDFTPSAIDVTHRFLMECMRMYPVVPMSLRNVMNSCVVEGYELPVGSRIAIAQTATHYMEEVFPNPFSFDIERYLPPRNEHRSPGYAPYGLGTHRCLGFRWMELQVAVNLLIIAHYFTLEAPPNSKMRISPVPGLSPSKKMKLVVTEKRREMKV